ncbi:MAG: DUF1318 domain-containing protein [Verrucomicrobiae bacterium]|nr:DUF1318 domain-containing protein [Verrucomicrobiae bacterium]
MTILLPKRCARFMKLIIGAVLLAVSVTAAQAGDFEVLKASIQFRMPKIRELKDAGLVSEGPNGFLLPSADAPAEARTLADNENSERLRMFGIVADRSGLQVDAVARRFVEMAGGAGSAPHPVDPIRTEARHADFVPVSEGSSLPLKVLVRPKSPMYAEASENSNIIDGDVPAFSAWVVLAKTNQWYQLSESVGRGASGWMKASDLMEWRHHMVVSFTHPGNRSRNLIFKERQPILDLLKKPQNERKSLWSGYLESAQTGSSEMTVGVEPDGWVREKNQFYLFPILDQQEIQNAGQEITLVKIAAATRERGKIQEPAQLPRKVPPKLDIVFVMDLTRSMGPFVDTTLEMLGSIANSFEDEAAGGGSVRFGFWGYRDDPELCDGIEFNTQNFTTDLQDVKTFLGTLRTIKETKVDSIDYAEDVFAGVSDAITGSKWRDGSVRTILLVGDAPGRPPGEEERESRIRPRPKGTAANMDAVALRALADSSSVYLASYYLESPKWKAFTPKGVAQFRSLALNPGSTEPAFAVINAESPQDYAEAAQAYASQMAQNLALLAKEGRIPQAEEDVAAHSSNPTDTGRSMADNLFRNAFIEWESANAEVKAPRDIEGWMADKDPGDPSKLALEPGVLLTKTQLSELRDRVNEIIDAMLRVEVGGQDFFKELHAVVTIGGRDPGRLREARTLMESNHFPDFLTGLPYKSKIMGMTKDDWREMGADRANQYRNEIVSKVQYYAEIYRDGTKWQKLNANADSGEYVTPIPIDMLP